MEEKGRDGGSKPKSRQSLAHIPSKSNTTTDIGALKRAAEAKNKSSRSRGKSIGPGGLEALTETNLNVFKIPPPVKPRSILKPTIPLTPPKAIPSYDELRNNKSTAKTKSPPKNASEDLLIDFSTPGSSRNSVPGTTIPGTENLVDPFSPIANTTSSHDKGDRDAQERKRQEQKKAALERQAARRKSLGNRRVSFAPEATLHTWSVMEMAEDSTTSSAANSTRRQSSMTAAQSPKLPASTPARPDQRFSTPEEQTSDDISPDTPESQRELHQRKRRRTSDISQTDEDDSFSSPGDGVESSPIRVEDSIDSESDTDGDTAMSLDDVTQNTVRSSGSSETRTSLDERLRQAEGYAGTQPLDQIHDDTEDEISDEDDGGDQPMDLVDGTVTHAFRQYACKAPQTQSSHRQDSSRDHLAQTGDDDLTYPSLDHLNTDDETMGMTMEMTRAVGGIMPTTRQARPNKASERQTSASRPELTENDISYGDETMDMTVAKGGILSGASRDYSDEEDALEEEDMTMEMTRAVGGIRSSAKQNSTFSFNTDETESMEMTMAAGRILDPIEEQTEPQSVVNGDYTSAMDMTRAVGKILSAPTRPDDEHYTRNSSVGEDELTTAMDLTKAIGGVLLPQVEVGEDLTEIQMAGLDDDTVAMDMTRAVGDILSTSHPQPLGAMLPRQSTTALASVTGQETDPSALTTAEHTIAPVASETGSPTFKPRSSSRKAAMPRQSTTPTTSPRVRVPFAITDTDQTPSRHTAASSVKHVSPKRTPILTANACTRSASPKKLFAQEIQQRMSPARTSPRKKQVSLFSRDEVTGVQTPKVVLAASKPRDHLRRKSSATPLINRADASPKVTELLSRRRSIGELAASFQLNTAPKKQIHFEDPRQVEQEVDLDRAEEHRRESGRFVMEREADEPVEENTIQNLKDMIQSMTPQKEPKSRLKGRKSLAVGSGKGLLGKRPTELDVDDDDDDEQTPKRLKTVSREGSPVKKVHLPKPPTKEQTTGRLSKIEQRALNGEAGEAVTPTTKPASHEQTQTPEHTGHFKSPRTAAKPVSFEKRLDNVIGAADITTVNPSDSNDEVADKISLQDFLNMTNIHFIELSTTKRRHTLAPSDENSVEPEDGTGTSRGIFVAAATTLPLLDLYQHATRELKSYISSGRKIIRQIETETMAEQPALFKQYVDARTEIKVAMDNQFRNGKTNARLQSKEGWYGWRTQLVDGLHTGLAGIRSDLEIDQETLSTQQTMLSSLLPESLIRKAQLEHQISDMRRQVEEFDSTDHELLQVRREELKSVDFAAAQKSDRIAQLKQRLDDVRGFVSSAQEMRQEITAQITEAVRVQEEQRRWPMKEVSKYKDVVDQLESRTGWKVLAARENGSIGNIELTMIYQGQLKLIFTPSMLAPINEREGMDSEQIPASNIGAIRFPVLEYAPEDEDETKSPFLCPSREFVLNAIKSRLRYLLNNSRERVGTRTLLNLVSSGWSLADRLECELQELETRGLVRTTKGQAGDFKAKLMLMLPNKNRVDITFSSTIEEDNLGTMPSLATSVQAAVIYGSEVSFIDTGKRRKVEAALLKEIEGGEFGKSSWLNAVSGFESWVRAQSAEPEPSRVTAPAVSSEVPLSRTVSTEAAPTRARTTSPTAVRSTTPKKAPSRSPLAPRTTNSKIVKKLPVPKKIVQHESLIPQPTNFRDSQAQRDKENQVSSKVMAVVANHEEMSYDEAFGLKNGIKPAIVTDGQETNMQTPIKRRAGALRRSPI